jgi:AraC-like DNA-binding protein
VHRKVIRGGQRTVVARLRLGAHEAVLGVPASEITERIVSLDDLWGDVATKRLLERLAAARHATTAAAVLEGAIAERLALARGSWGGPRLAFDAADRLKSANVNAVAAELGVSDRHLRRVFRATFGMNPKTFAKLERFNYALAAARKEGHENWARIAAEAGYYDQAHLIAEFRMIAGVTPQALLDELGAAPAV